MTRHQWEAELLNLQARANRVNFKNKIPRLPNNLKWSNNDHLMIGFEKRIFNWKKGLEQYENPHGLIYDIPVKSFNDFGHFVIDTEFEQS